jgi:UDP-3-O-[3-hydroxymyristoyl] N-acetylglucosamine deacetylase
MVCRDLGILKRIGTQSSRSDLLSKVSGWGSYRMKFSRQTTLRSQATVTGVGVHSGLPVSLTLGPASVDAGFIFVRTGLEGADREVQATAESVIATEFATVLGDRDGPLVSTAEHVLAALRGMGVDNATIEVDGPEVPIMDGSAAAFVAAIDQAGIVTQSASRRFIQVLKPVQVAMGDSFGELRPYAAGFRAEVEIDFANPVIGRQNYTLDLSPERFRREISRARTFGCMNDVARLWSAGFALGASFENSVVFDETRLLNTEGLRYTDECARHKVLDVIGDLALAGLPLLGAYRSVRGGHKLNHAVLTALLADRSAWRVIEAETARRSRTHAEAGSGMVGGMIAPAYSPDVS